MGCSLISNCRSSSCSHTIALVCATIVAFVAVSDCGRGATAIFTDDFSVTWGAANNTKLIDNGSGMQLILNNFSASGFASKQTYLFGSIDMQIQLVPGNSAGTVTAYYFSSDTTDHDEVDFEFLGNVTGQPYILQTNVYASGVGGREERIYLWFDPSAGFHTYSVLWNEEHIILSVDDIPIRQFLNNEAAGLPYLSKQPMRIYSSIWDGSTWATRGGLDKIDWGHSPFVASYGAYTLDACTEAEGSACPADKWWNETIYNVLDASQQGQLTWVREFFLIYDYCTDSKRYPIPPQECTLTT